jgi:hypothetical protein
VDNARSLAATILAESDADLEGARSAEKMEVKKAGMGMLFVSRLWKMTKLAIPSYTCKTAYILYLLISVNICRAVVIIYQAYYSSDLFLRLGPSQWDALVRVIALWPAPRPLHPRRLHEEHPFQLFPPEGSARGEASSMDWTRWTRCGGRPVPIHRLPMVMHLRLPVVHWP